MNPTRRNVLLALGGTAAAGGVVLGSGAFTTVEATRTAEVNVTGDGSAYLALQPIGPGSNETGSRNQSEDYDGEDNPYADFNGDELEITIGENAEGAEGVNPNARTVIRQIFRVTNQGTQDVGVTITPQFEDSASGAQKESITFFDNSEGTDTGLDENATTLEPGEFFDVSLEIDTTDVKEIPLEEVTISADVEDA